MKTKKVLTACLALLLMSNVSFAQIKPRYEQAKRDNTYVDSVKAAAKLVLINKQTKKQGNTQDEYSRILHHIKTSEQDPAETGFAAAAGAAVTAGAIAGMVSDPVIVASYTAEKILGVTLASTVVIEATLVCAATITVIAGKKWVCDKINFSGKDKSAENKEYSAIAQALGQSEIFSKYQVILTGIRKNPDPKKEYATPLHLEKTALQRLAKFLQNPRDYKAKYDKNLPERDYRFYFDFPSGHPELANERVYAEVDIDSKVIIVSSSSYGEKKTTTKHNIKAKKK